MAHHDSAQTRFVRRLVFGDYETPEALAHSVRTVQRMGCDRVMLFESRGHIEPAHLEYEEALRRADAMRTAAATFRAAGIGVGINNLCTVGMSYSPLPLRQWPFQNLIDFDGAVRPGSFCPLDPGLRNHVERQFAVWAAVGPDEVWVDDDFCYKTGSQQCFCPLHLQRLESISGRTWTHEQLIPAITTRGLLPSDLTRQWGQMQHDALVEFAQVIADAVRKENPRVRIAFMGMTLKVPFYGTDTLRRLGRTFSPESAPLLRPEYGAYADEDRVGWNAYATRWCTQRAFGDRFEAWPEVETWPQVGFNHGARVVEMKLLWGALHGFTSSTVNVSDEPRMVAAVARAKRQVAAVGALLNQAPWRTRGVSLELGENTVGLRPKPGAVALSHESATLLARLGVPLWPDGGCGRILVGNSPLPRQDELTGFAREGLILDREAFEHVAALGRDDLVGGARSRPLDAIPARERYGDAPRNASAAGHVMSMELAVPVRPTVEGFDLPDGDEIAELSCFESADGRVLSPGVWTRQWSGGRLVVLPFSLQEVESKYAFLNLYRQAQLVSLLAWAAEIPLPARVEGFPDLAVVYRETEGRILIGLANFALDDAEDYSLVLPAIPEGSGVQVSGLDRAGRWRTTRETVVTGGLIRAITGMAVPAQSVRVIEFRILGT